MTISLSLFLYLLSIVLLGALTVFVWRLDSTLSKRVYRLERASRCVLPAIPLSAGFTLTFLLSLLYRIPFLVHGPYYNRLTRLTLPFISLGIFALFSWKLARSEGRGTRATGIVYLVLGGTLLVLNLVSLL